VLPGQVKEPAENGLTGVVQVGRATRRGEGKCRAMGEADDALQVPAVYDGTRGLAARR